MTILNIIPFMIFLLEIFIKIQTCVYPAQLFKIQDDIVTSYYAQTKNYGSQLYISCALVDSSIVIRKYFVAGNTYFKAGTYVGPSIASPYDYMIFTNNYLISGSKINGNMRIWNLTSFAYISQISTSIYATKFIYHPEYQKIIYIQTNTKIVKGIPTASFPLGMEIQNTNWTADNIILVSTRNLLILLSSSSVYNTVLRFSDLTVQGTLQSSITGIRNVEVTANEVYLLIATTYFDQNAKITKTSAQRFNFNSLDPAMPLAPSFIYNLTGKSDMIMYWDTTNEAVIPVISPSKVISFQVLWYTSSARLLQNFDMQSIFPLTYTNSYYFYFDMSDLFLSVIFDGNLYFFALQGKCLNNQYQNLYASGLDCFNCQTNCAACTYSRCVLCQSGYILDSTFQCIVDNTNNTMSNITTNTTTNTTTNNTNIVTNITILNNSTGNNVIFISKTFSKSALFSFLKVMYFNAVLKALNKVPASRKVLKPLFRFFVNLDDLWLYYYHKRSYCNTTLEMFQSIQDLENQKWELLHAQKILDKLQVSEQDVQSYFSYLDAISKSKDNFVQRQKKNSGYFINSLDFYMSNLALIIATFIILRLIFKILQKYFISVFLREYSFYVFLGIMIMQGNLQYFVYLITNQMQMLSDDIFSHKLSHIYALLTFLSLFSFSCMCFIVILFAYERKHSKYFFDNTKVNFKGSFYLFMACFMKNIMLGFIHSYFNYNYVCKIFLLWSVQFLFLLIHITILAKKDIESSTRQWVIITCGFLRLLIIFSFYLDYRLGVNFANLQSFQQSLFMAYLMVGLLSLSYQIISFIYQSIVLSRKYVFQTSSVKVYQDSSDSISEKKYQKTLNAVSKMKYSSTSKYFSRKRSSFKAFKIESVQDTLSLSSNNQNLNNIEIQQSKLFQAFQTKKTIKKNPFQRIRIKKNGLKKQFQKLQVQSQQKKSYQ